MMSESEKALDALDWLQCNYITPHAKRPLETDRCLNIIRKTLQAPWLDIKEIKESILRVRQAKNAVLRQGCGDGTHMLPDSPKVRIYIHDLITILDALQASQ